MPIELGAVDAAEFRLAADDDPADTAHAGRVNHYRIEPDDRFDPEGPGGLRRQIGEIGAALCVNDINSVILQIAGQEIIYVAFEASGAVARYLVEIIALLFQFILPVEQEFTSRLDRGDHAVALFFECLDHGPKCTDAIAATDA